MLHLLSQIRILSPDVWPVVDDCSTRLAATELFYLHAKEEDYDLLNTVDEVLLVAAKALRKDLGIEPDEPRRQKPDFEELYQQSVDHVRDSKASDGYRHEE